MSKPHQPRPAGPRAPLSAALTTLALMAGLGALPTAQAQFAQVPSPLTEGTTPPASQAQDGDAYRMDAARHLYEAFRTRVHKGKLPPMMYAVMITEADIDAAGQITAVRVVRGPAAATEVAPWVVSLIRRAAPYPAPARLNGSTATWREIWLVDKTGLFQVDALTEGQR